MRAFLLLLLLFSDISLFAQDPDSLFKVADLLPERDTQKVSLLNEAGIAFWKSGMDSAAVFCHERAIQLARAIPFHTGEITGRLQLVLMEMEYLSDLETAYAQLDTALIVAKEAGDRKLEAQTYFRRAQLYSMGIWEYSAEVKPLFEKALDIFRETGDKTWEGMVYTQFAGLESDEGRFAVAIDYLLRARRLQEESGDIKSLRATIPNLGVMYMNIGLFDNALQCFEEARVNAVATNDERVLAFLNGQKGEVYLKQDNAKMALRELEEAVKKYEQLGGVQFLTGTYARMGEAYLKLDSIDRALTYAQKADSLFKHITDGADLLSHSAQIVLGNIYLQKKQYPQVIQLAEKGLEWAEGAEPVLLREASEYHRQLALAYESTGATGRALTHQKKFKAHSDSLLNAEMIQRVTASSLAFDFEKAQQADQIRIQVLENRNLVQTRNVIIVLSVTGLVALLFVIWVNRRLKQKNEELIRKNRDIEFALHKGQNIERKRVASELHDSLNTKIASIRWQLESLDTAGFDERNKKITRQLMDIVGAAYDDIRLISHNLVPEELEKEGLVAATKKLVSQLGTLNDITFELHSELTGRLPVKTEHQLYHITLELINNVIKHANASEVMISLNKSDDTVELVIADNGVGFGGAVNGRGGVGLTNVNSRAASIGGSCQLENGLDGGAFVKIRVPDEKQLNEAS